LKFNRSFHPCFMNHFSVISYTGNILGRGTTTILVFLSLDFVYLEVWISVTKKIFFWKKYSHISILNFLDFKPFSILNPFLLDKIINFNFSSIFALIVECKSFFLLKNSKKKIKILTKSFLCARVLNVIVKFWRTNFIN
jgi:hypothetical protein